MDEPVQAPERSPPAPPEEARGGEYEALRTLLLGEERAELDELRERLDDAVLRAEEMAEVLPDAIVVRAATDERLTTALQPTVAKALKESVDKDPKALTDAIFPVLLPAIRRSISAALLGMVQSLNHVLQNSLSVTGLRWRFQAWRTGVPYAEVVLLNTLLYRVEQVVLIHRETGVVLQHVALGGVEAQDPDLVSGMLSAIQSFMEDSFHEEGGRLDTIRIGGDRSLWVEEGPRTLLATLIRGTPPLTLRERMQELLEAIRSTHGSLVTAFDGDTAPFAMVRDDLAGLLESHFAREERGISPLTWIIVAVLVLVPLVWLGFAVTTHRARDAFVRSLAAEEGIVVTGTRTDEGVFHVTGLRDPLAVDPEVLLAESGLDAERVALTFEPYQAGTPGLALTRARALLGPPDGVSLALLGGGVLQVTGQAPGRWVERLELLAPVLPGVQRLDREMLESPDLEELRAAVAELDSLVLYARLGSAELVAGQGAALDRAADLLQAILESPVLGERPLQVRVTGYADASGSEAVNLRLSRERASLVSDLLVQRGLPAGALVDRGGGVLASPGESVGAARDSRVPAPESQARRITFSVLGLPETVRFNR